MTARQGPGGVIPPDGRPPRPPAEGAQARRHDLERPATPGLHGSDLQVGDVQRLEQAQQIQGIGKKVQQPNPAGRVQAQPGGGGGQFSMSVPDPIEFAKQRLGGTLAGPPASGGGEFTADVTPWLPLLRRLATAPGAGGTLASRYVEAIANLQRQPRRSGIRTVNFNDLDDALETSLGG